MRALLTGLIATILSLGLAASAQQGPAPSHRIIEVKIKNPLDGDPHQTSFSGRLIVRLAPSVPAVFGLPLPPAPPDPTPAQQKMRERNLQTMETMNFSMAAMKPFDGLAAFAIDVSNVDPGDVIRLDAGAISMSKRLSDLPAGDYSAYAVLDAHDNFAVSNNLSWDDLRSNMEHVRLGDGPTRLTLVWQTKAREDWPSSKAGTPAEAQMAGARAASRDINFVSPMLSAFYGKPTAIRGYVVLPPDYDISGQTYPVDYHFRRFGETFDQLPVMQLLQFQAAMSRQSRPPMLYVVLDQFGPSGAHNFVDSATHGPWAKALAEEFIPWFETQYRADAKPSGRMLTGEEAGGYTALWLLAKNPKMFAGAWMKSPDPVDFHGFLNTDIYAANANMFNGGTGEAKLMVREQKYNGDRFTYSARAASELETVYGPGGRLASFERAFSPLGPDRKPLALFDRSTGAVDPAVAKYWGEHYDLSRYLSANWPKLKADLDGKIHIVAGGEDGQFRNIAVDALKQTLDGLGAKSDIATPRGRDENNLFYVEDKWSIEMNGIARPGATWRPQHPPPPRN